MTVAKSNSQMMLTMINYVYILIFCKNTNLNEVENEMTSKKSILLNYAEITVNKVT